jgi:hypothetical protein
MYLEHKRRREMQYSTRTYRPSKALAVMQEARKLGFAEARMEQVSGHVGAVVIGDTWLYDDSEWAAFKQTHGIAERKVVFESVGVVEDFE